MATLIHPASFRLLLATLCIVAGLGLSGTSALSEDIKESEPLMASGVIQDPATIYNPEKFLAPEKVQRRYGLQNPGQQYPVTIFDPAKVPLPAGSPRSVFWIDPETAIYPVEIPFKEGEFKTYPRRVEIKTVNLKSLDVKKITEGVGGWFCYDTDTKAIQVADSSVDDKKEKTLTIKARHGILGKKLTPVTTVFERGKKYTTRLFECPNPTLLNKKPYIVDGIVMRRLPRGHGFIGHVWDSDKVVATDPVGTYQFISPNGVKKKFSVHQSKRMRAGLPQFDPAKNEYYIFLYEGDGSLSFWRYDHEFNLISENNFRKFPWAPGTFPVVSRDGYLFYKAPSSTPFGQLYLLNYDGKVTEVMQGYGFLGWIAVSPDGCNGLFLSETRVCCKHPPVPAVVELCGAKETK